MYSSFKEQKGLRDIKMLVSGICGTKQQFYLDEDQNGIK